MRTISKLSRNVCILMAFAFVMMPLVGAAPTMAKTGGVIELLVGAHADVTGKYDIDPNDLTPMACTPAAANWVISSGTVTCSGQTFSVQDQVTIQAGATLILDAGTTMTLTSSSYWGGINVYGNLKVLNSTVKSTSWTYYQTIYFYGGTIRLEGATVSNFYYGLQAWNGGKLSVNHTTFSGNYYYGAYLSMVTGFITNSTIQSTSYYGLYISNLMNFKVNNNTFKNNMYGAMMYSYSGELNDNIFQSNTQYGLYVYSSTPSMNRNKFISNSVAGLYSYSWQQSTLTMLNCSFQNNGRDMDLEASGGTNVIKSINSKFNTVVFDQNGWGGGKSSLEVYWFANASIKWLADSKPVEGAIVHIEDKTGGAYAAGDLVTDATGNVNWLALMEYSEAKTGKTLKSPYWINATGTFQNRDIMNFSQTDITKDGVNKADLFLDNVPPPLLITAPTDKYLTNSTNVTVKGYTEHNTEPTKRPVTVQVRLGGTSFTPSVSATGYFEQILYLPVEGNNNIDVSAFDWVLNSIKTKFTVVRDTINPPLEVYAPADGILTNQTTITVNGTTEPNAQLWVNTKLITVSGDGKWTTTVTLKEMDNTIFVKAQDAALNWVMKTRSVKVDTKAPMLVISEPNNGYKTNDKSLRVSGLTEAGTRVFVNFVPVAVAGANFQASIQLSEGENKLFIDAVDTAGNHNYTWRTVLLDTIPPKLEITDPAANNVLTNQDEITIKGYVDPGSKMWIGKEEVAFSGDWTYILKLKEGKNKVIIEAVDDVGNKVNLGRNIVRDSTPPVLAIFNPQDKITVIDSNIMVEGSVEPGANLTVNGKGVSSVGGVFSTQLKLTEGENTITLVARDAAGNTKTEVRTVILDTNVNLKLDDGTMASAGKQVAKANFTVSGKTDPGASVYINGEKIKVKNDGAFTYGMNLLEGNNSIRVQAVDQYSNTKTVEMWVVLKSSSSIGNFGSSAADKTNILIWIMVIALLVGAVAVMGGHSAYSKKRTRDADMKAQQEVQAAAIKQDTQQPAPSGIYQQLYGGQQQAYPASPEAPTAYGTATAVAPTDVTMTGASPEITTRLDEVEAKITEAEAQGTSGVDGRRNLRLARQFAARGNSDKAEYYAEKALDSIGQH